MYFIETQRGLKWHYELEGNGQAILFFHGWGVNMRVWRQQMKHFSQSHRVMAVDLPGHGKTMWKDVTLEEMACEIEEITERLSISSYGVVASSFGGLLALKLCELYPGRVRFLVFVGAQAKFARSKDYPYGLDIKRIRHLASQLDRAYPTIVHIFFRSLFTFRERESRRFKWVQRFRSADVIPQKEALQGLLEILEKEDLRDVLDRIDLPLQLINGTEDDICSPELYRELKKKMPRALLHWFDHCGHFPFISRPHSFNDALSGFLKTVDVA